MNITEPELHELMPKNKYGERYTRRTANQAVDSRHVMVYIARFLLLFPTHCFNLSDAC
jgi:hypothetical protein